MHLRLCWRSSLYFDYVLTGARSRSFVEWCHLADTCSRSSYWWKDLFPCYWHFSGLVDSYFTWDDYFVNWVFSPFCQFLILMLIDVVSCLKLLFASFLTFSRDVLAWPNCVISKHFLKSIAIEFTLSHSMSKLLRFNVESISYLCMVNF